MIKNLLKVGKSSNIHKRIEERSFYEQAFGEHKRRTKETAGRYKHARKRLQKGGSFKFKAGKVIK
jgi:hypothetical protein